MRVLRDCPSIFKDSCIDSSVSVSRDEVASSRITIGESFKRQRAIATRCFSPPLSFKPLSPTIVSNPFGRRARRPSNFACLATSSTFS
mmetsp:Transcript_6139/g.12464  ORF Transcript_6139/g.12464 Transcript_6139/m.12464 type:complete len:88 (+) Transcript_6139:196-459(+)